MMTFGVSRSDFDVTSSSVSWVALGTALWGSPQWRNLASVRELGNSLVYGYAVASEQPQEGLWWFLFYERALFVVTTSLKEKDANE